MANGHPPPKTSYSWRQWLYETIFETNTAAGRRFDILLIICIISSVIVVTLDSVKAIQADWGRFFNLLEWIFTLLFTIEYVLRLVAIGKPAKCYWQTG